MLPTDPPAPVPLPAGPPAPKPPPPPPNPLAQVPDVGWLMVTDRAVTDVPNACRRVDAPEVGVPNAEMQDPTDTEAAVAGTVWSKVVVGV